MDANSLAVIAGIAISLGFEYLPGFREWFTSLGDVQKRGFMAAVLFAVTLVIFALSCFSPYTWVECTSNGFWAILEAFFVALVANQTTHRIAKRA